MEKLSRESQIWFSQVKPSDIKEAINYATISLPWTFDRMRYGPKSQRKVNNRLIHILIGVLNQTILERELTSRGYMCSKDWTKYRESDVFDFLIKGKIYDVKTVHIYSKYNDDWNREQFTPKLLISNRSNRGPQWRLFFPIMVTLSQLTVEKKKDSYIFGITETYEDLRIIKPKIEDKGFWCAAPYDKAFSFFQSTSVIKAREKEGNGFYVKVVWKRFQKRIIQNEVKHLTLTLFGEWDGRRQTEDIKIAEGGKYISRKEFSSLSCVRFNNPAVLDENDKIVFSVKNNFENYIPKTTNPKINLNDPNFEWVVNKESFVNLRVPDDYKVYWLGHIPFRKFASLFQNYDSYFIPKPNLDVNQKGRVAGKLKEKLRAMDNRRTRAIKEGINVSWPEFLSLVKGQNINAGLLIAMMRGNRPIGAACYFYPPYGLQESAIYILPKDLYEMDSL